MGDEEHGELSVHLPAVVLVDAHPKSDGRDNHCPIRVGEERHHDPFPLVRPNYHIIMNLCRILLYLGCDRCTNLNAPFPLQPDPCTRDRLTPGCGGYAAPQPRADIVGGVMECFSLPRKRM